jgi:hypothetical protein
MSAAHTCFRSALSQAFRSSNRGIAAAYTVPAFLVPALAQPSKRPFSSGKRRSREQQPEDTATYVYHTKPAKEPIRSCIPFPPSDARGDIEEWLAVLDPFLPAHLRRTHSDSPDVSATVTSLDLACVLNEAQDASLDIISYMGLVEGRWPTALWIVKKLVEEGRRSIQPPIQLDPFVNIAWPESEPQSLKELTERRILTERVRPSRRLKLTLDNMTSAPDSIDIRHRMVKRALGQLWRSLGNLILVAAERSSTEAEQIMPHVLEVIAYLHHMGFMPDSVYTYRPHKDKYALQQPPTLHMLSSKILTALSDATWKAHEASVKSAQDRAKATYFLGHEVPGSRHRIKAKELIPELWLELVLWSCLHGGWTLDGAVILEQLAAKQGDQRWALVSWREIMQAEEKKKHVLSRAWTLFPTTGDTTASPQDRARTHRTISGEVVTAFADGLVNQMRVGVGGRGVDPETLLKFLETLKGFLDVNNLSLGSAAWDSIMVRLLESGGFEPENRPELLLRIFKLAPGFGAEISTANASASRDTDVPYFFEPTTIPLSLLHRAMRTFIGTGDINGAMTTLMLLQRHTDNNKQKSVQQFFELLRSTPVSRKEEPFTSRLPPVDFPAFDTKLPVPLLARLLDLATESKLYDLGRWLLFSNDIDGPLIGPELYSNRNIAASIVRFGTFAGENALVLNTVKKMSTWNEKHQQQRMPAEILIALLCCQIKLRRWESVQGIQKYVQETSTFRPRPIILSTFAAELLRTSNEAVETLMQAQAAFTALLFAWEYLILNNVRNELYCILAIMTSISGGWKDFCAQFLTTTMRQTIKLSTDDFNRVLGGVLDGYGSTKGRETVEHWCYTMPKMFKPFKALGGLPTMRQYGYGAAEAYRDRPEDLEFVHESGAKLLVQGRVLPNRQTIWVILRKVEEEVEQRREHGDDLTDDTRVEVRDTLQWAARMLYYLGFEYEDVVRDLGSSLAELAELEAPAPPNDMGQYSESAEKQEF